MHEFLAGARLLGGGWSWWRRRPGTMARGLIPAVIVGAVVLAALIALVANLGAVGDALTPFADGWSPGWERAAELAAQGVVLVGSVVLVVVTFTALTLAVGEPFYDRIWRAVEQDTTGTVPEGSTGVWRGAADGVARGLSRRERNALLRAHRTRALGFGVATQLCFLVPGGAVATMPAAVAGSTLLAQSVLPRGAGARVAGGAPGARVPGASAPVAGGPGPARAAGAASLPVPT